MNHLTKEQLANLKQQLVETRMQLQSEIREELLRSDGEQWGDLAGQVHDPGEESVADLLVDTNITMVGKSVAQLREVEEALQRINMGSYGLCEDCGAEIPYERLKAYPTARRDLEHQAKFEKSFAEEGKPTI